MQDGVNTLADHLEIFIYLVVQGGHHGDVVGKIIRITLPVMTVMLAVPLLLVAMLHMLLRKKVG